MSDSEAQADDERPDDEQIELTPEQTESLRPTMAKLQSSLASQIKLPTETYQAMLTGLNPIRDVQAAWQKQISGIISADVFKNLASQQADLGRITERFARNIDFSGITQSLAGVAKISATFAEQQSALSKNLAPALKAMRDSFYPPNLRALEGLGFEEVDRVVMADGIPLYGVPRTDIAEALIRADNLSKRREILGRRWKAISADCRAAVEGCASKTLALYASFAVAALDALDAGHTEAAQALAGSIVDTIITGYFGDDRFKYTPSRKNITTDAYNEFTVREFIAFAPIWKTYQQFFVTNGDKVPTTFSRHATAHAVSTRQYNRRNAVQGLMLVCGLLCRLDEEAAALEADT